MKALGTSALINFFSVTETIDGLDQYIESILAALAKVIQEGEPRVVDQVKKSTFWNYSHEFGSIIYCYFASYGF